MTVLETGHGASASFLSYHTSLRREIEQKQKSDPEDCASDVGEAAELVPTNSALGRGRAKRLNVCSSTQTTLIKALQPKADGSDTESQM